MNMEQISIFSQQGEDNLVIEKNQKLTTLPYLGKQFSVSFQLLFRYFPTVNPYESVLHLTVGPNAGSLGSRIPGIWATKYNKLMVVHSINGKWDAYREVAGMNGSFWHSVSVSQELRNGKV